MKVKPEAPIESPLNVNDLCNVSPAKEVPFKPKFILTLSPSAYVAIVPEAVFQVAVVSMYG